MLNSSKVATTLKSDIETNSELAVSFHLTSRGVVYIDFNYFPAAMTAHVATTYTLDALARCNEYYRIILKSF